MRVFQIGAAGGVGLRLSTLLKNRGDDVTGMHRNPGQADTIRKAGGDPVIGDLISNTIEELANLMSGHDAVVFSAGAHGTGRDKTTLIDGNGAAKAAKAAEIAGATRFILVSAFPESERAKDLGEDFEHYMRVKKTADVYLTHTNLDWIVVRPGMLRDEAGSGLVSAGVAVEYGEVARDNVAAFIATSLHEPALSRVIVELVDGDTPVTDAIESIVELSGPRR